MLGAKNQFERNSWLVVIYSMLAYVTIYIGRKNLSVCLSDMIADGVTDKVSGGAIGTAFLICYAAGQFINGRLGDRIHPRNMMSIGLFAAGLMNIAMGLVSSSTLFTIIWGFCGLACSMLWSPFIRAISTWTTEEISRAAAASTAATIPIGTILCYLICSFGLKFFGWRAAFILCGGLLIVMSAVIYLCFLGLKEHMSEDNIPKIEISENGGRQSTVKIFCIGLIFAAFGILFNGILKDGLDLWIPTVLGEKFIPSASAVSLICTILPLINLFGAYFARFLYRRFRLDELTTCTVMFAISAISLAVVTLFINIIPNKPEGATIGFTDIILALTVTVLLALTSAAMLGANTMLLTFIPLHFGKIGRASTVTGMLNCLSYAAAAVSGIAIGFISENFDWEIVFAVFVASALLGALLTFVGHGKMREKTDELDSIVRIK